MRTVLLFLAFSISQASAPQEPATDQVAATVNGVPIHVAEVQRGVERALGDRQADPAALRILRATVLERLVQRQVVLAYLETRGEACADQELDLELGRLRDELARQEKTLDDYYQSTGHNDVSLRQQLRWQLSWRRYLARYLTDENLARYFEQHRQQFDGTTMRIAQILLKCPLGDAAARKTCLERAAAIRAKIVAGHISFADAARRHSQAPSASKGGAIGWIARHEPMPEVLSRAAFQLKQGDVSRPFASRFGVHLIECLEVKRGEKKWQQVRPALVDAVTSYIFSWASTRPGVRPDIQFTGAVPHFKPGTHQLAKEGNTDPR